MEMKFSQAVVGFRWTRKVDSKGERVYLDLGRDSLVRSRLDEVKWNFEGQKFDSSFRSENYAGDGEVIDASKMLDLQVKADATRG